MNELLNLGYKRTEANFEENIVFIKEYKDEYGDLIERTITFNTENYTVIAADFNTTYDIYDGNECANLTIDELKAILATLEELKVGK